MIPASFLSSLLTKANTGKVRWEGLNMGPWLRHLPDPPMSSSVRAMQRIAGNTLMRAVWLRVVRRQSRRGERAPCLAWGWARRRGVRIDWGVTVSCFQSLIRTLLTFIRLGRRRVLLRLIDTIETVTAKWTGSSAVLTAFITTRPDRPTQICNFNRKTGLLVLFLVAGGGLCTIHRFVAGSFLFFCPF